MVQPFITVHLGAGNHRRSLERQLKKLTKNCCNHGMELFENGKSSVEVAVEVCKMLEDSKLTNAGFGSQLNFDLKVECDASIMESSQLKGASVGAIQDISNPIAIAGELLSDLMKGESDVIGRVKPIMLVGEGARQYALSKGITLLEDHALVTRESLAYGLKWKKIYTQLLQDPSLNTDNDDLSGSIIQDTVGVICGDKTGTIAVASSSGGTTLKHPGRIGPAALIGTGINMVKNGDKTIALCLSGTGEDIIQSQLCVGLSSKLFEEDDISQYLDKIQSLYHFQRAPLYFGVLGIQMTAENSIELCYLHSTESFAVGYKYGSKPCVFTLSSGKSGAVKVGGLVFR